MQNDVAEHFGQVRFLAVSFLVKSNTLSKLGCNTALTAAAGAGGGSCRTESALGNREGEYEMSERDKEDQEERGVSCMLVLAQHLCMLCGPTRGDDKQQPPPPLA